MWSQSVFPSAIYRGKQGMRNAPENVETLQQSVGEYCNKSYLQQNRNSTPWKTHRAFELW